MNDPESLLAAARDLVQGDVEAGAWPRMTAFLLRQALEESIDDFWDGRVQAFGSQTWKTKLLCLPFYTDHQVAKQASELWGTLSYACHHHYYGSEPTAAELQGWTAAVERIIQEVG